MHAKMLLRTRVAALMVLALTCFLAPSSAFPRPEDSAMVVTSTTAPSASSTAPASQPEAAVPGTSAASETQLQEKQTTTAPQVRNLHVLSTVQYRYAHTVVSSRVANPANMSQEVTFSVVLPETAFISSFAMEVDGKIYKAYVKEKQEAKQTYDAAVAAGQSAAHVAVSARDSNSFTVSLNVEAQNKVSFNLTYEELLTRKLGLYEHVITLNPGQVVNDLQVRVHIKENKKISKLRVPEFSSGNKIDADVQECDDITETKPTKCASGNNLATITWNNPSDVEILFRPSEAEQKAIVLKLQEAKKKAEEADANLGHRLNSMRWDVFQPSDDDARGDKREQGGLNGQFSVEYDVDRGTDGGEVVVNDGYFVHFFSPSELKPLKKHAIFVLDVSGSMDGRKIEQLREAMMAILNDLKDGDYFNLIAFSGDVKVWNLDHPDKSALYRPSEGYFHASDAATTEAPQERPPAYRATKENIEKAKEVVKQLSAYGGTNINDALKTALDCARDGARSAAMSDGDQTLEPIILFLTDGDPTVGLTVPTKITAGISELNLKPRSAVFSLAFGEGADIKFLRKLSLANGGFARTIYEAADASLQLKNFYRQISSPLLANVTFNYIPDKVERDSMTKLEFRTYFDGTELVVAGRTADKGIQELGGNVQAVADGGKHTTYSPHLVAIDEPLTIYPFDIEGPLFNRTLHQAPREASVLERLWAYLTIKQLLDEQDALDAKTFTEEVIRPTWVRPPMQPVPPPLALPALSVTVPPTSTEATTASSTSAAADATTSGSVNATEDALDLSVLKPEPKQRALQLALKYSFVTPLTSLVVVKPNETKATDAQTVNPDAVAAASLQGGPSASRWSGVVPASAFVVSSQMMTANAFTYMNALSSGPFILSNRGSPGAAAGLVRRGSLQDISRFRVQAKSRKIVNPDAGEAEPAGPNDSWTVNRIAGGAHYAAAMLGAPPPGFPAPVAESFVAPLALPMMPMPPPPQSTRAPMQGFTDAATGLAQLGADERDPVSHKLPPLPTTTTTSAPLLNSLVNISDVEWLPKDALQKGTVLLPLNMSGTDKSYKIGSNETDPDPPQSCDISGSVPSKGVCRHFSNCVLAQVSERIEEFYKYQCTIGEYLAICCPEQETPVSTTAQGTSPTPIP